MPSMDPQEKLDFIVDCAGLLETGETITDYTLTVGAEGVALGLTISSGSGRDHAILPGNTSVKFWLEVAAGYQSNAAYDGGVSLPLELAFTTSSVPSRTRQRTLLFSVAQRKQ